MDNIYKELLNYIEENKISLNEPMSKHTTFKIGGIADIFVRVNNLEELKHIFKIANKEKIPVTVIGNGSNLLVKDRRN